MMSKAYKNRPKKKKSKKPTLGGPNFTPKKGKSADPNHPQAMKELRNSILYH